LRRELIEDMALMPASGVADLTFATAFPRVLIANF
jgi:hypothetical protein